MPSAQVKVEKVFLKALNQPDQFGNTHRAKLVSGGVWYELGSTKQSTFGQLKTKAGFITEGALVEFMYDQSPSSQPGGSPFNNVIMNSVRILQPGVAPKATQQQATQQYQQSAPPPQQQYSQPNQAPQQVQYQSPQREGVQVGAAINQAVALLGPSNNPDFAKVESTAEALFLIAERIKKGDAKVGAVNPHPVVQQEQPPQQQYQQPVSASTQTQQQEQPAPFDDGFDDAIPF